MTPARLMIVEDERITAEDLRDLLTHMGYIVTAVVSTADDAIREAERTRPDLVMMDIQIKGETDGIEAARVLRSRLEIPVIYLTAFADAATLDRAKLAEPLGYVVKPFQESDLQASVEMALHKRRVDLRARERQEWLSATLGAIGGAVISVDSIGMVNYMNPAAEQWTGWRQAEAVGLALPNVARLVYGETGEPVGNLWSAVLRQGAIVELDEGVQLISLDGSRRTIGGSAAPVRDHSGTITGAVLLLDGARPVGEEASDSDDPAALVSLPGVPVIAASKAMCDLFRFVVRVARSEASSILLQGESGSGKDIVAKMLHYGGRRQSAAFLAINCAAIPEALLESELFGYEKGAFTDARARKQGMFELAHGGTLFLDEIGEMPLTLQAKMLRVLEEQRFRRLGGLNDIQVDMRVVAATNRDLRQAIQEGRFRLDLFYRLNVIQLRVPALRERRDDIVPLAQHFVQMLNHRFKRDVKGITPAAADRLMAHDWPGNVRELRNVIERAMLLEESPRIQAASLAFDTAAEPVESLAVATAAPRGEVVQGLTLPDAERTLLIQGLERAAWNQSKAARLLGISRDTLRYKMKKFALKQTPSS
jgi:PAS domain S-box-containing protein